MPRIVVPIDRSNIKDIIPEGEQIIYSTFFNAGYLGGTPMLTHMSGGSSIKQWGGHLLMTHKGIYMNAPTQLTQKEKEEVFVPWFNVSKSAFKTMFLEDVGSIERLPVVILRDSERETTEEFIERGKEFKDFINQMRNQAREQKAFELYNFLKENNKMKFKDYKKEYGDLSKSLFDTIKKNLKKGREPTANLE